MSQFAENVWLVLKTVPKGKVITYQLLATAAGNARACRAVGTILNHNQHIITIPCHRVVKSNGQVGGYVAGVFKKIALLQTEGVTIINNHIDLKHFLYTPAKLPYETN
ncbi:MAG: MGMT family protein [Candidatus Magasanikbacteria bacterium]|nr:MGMT family protein [Candidatus Magasanikbacteria bacterium]